METAILPCKSIPTALSDFSLKPQRPTISLNNSLQQTTSGPERRVPDDHPSHLCRNGRLRDAIAALESISQCRSKVRPNTFNRLIQCYTASNSIHLGRKLRKRIHLLRNVDPFIETKLVGVYSKCGHLEDARKVFDEMNDRDLYAWSAMIGAFSREKRWREVVKRFYLMMEEGVVPDDFLFPKILQACGKCGDVETGMLIHSIVIRSGIYSDLRVSNSILAVYAKCGELSLAKTFFGNMEWKDEVSWNSIITGYCQKGEIEKAHQMFELMREEGTEPGLVTWNILISKYNQLGYCDVAMEMLKEMENVGKTPDVFTWTSMISGFAQNNRRIQALELFREMSMVGVEPNGVTLASVIAACAFLKALRRGKELHSITVKIGCAEDVLVGNSLIDMYSKCGKLEAAQRVFDMLSKKDFYTWNSMIGGYCRSGYCGKAHDLFMLMQDSDVKPNVITWNVMITGHMQNGDEDQALDLFLRMGKDGIIKRNTASWNALIAGYLQNGHKNEAFGVFRQMQSLCVRPNSVTFLSILPACANLIAAKKVREIHGCVLRRNLEPELSIANSLIDVYARSGNIFYSRAIFDGMPSKDIITWNTLIAGSVLHGCSHAALALYEQMRKEGIRPTRSTFVSIISAYGLDKMIDEGKRIFSSMTEDYHILPGSGHCSAMIDLFGRSGRLQEAIEFIEDMTMRPDFSVWAALLTACRINGNIKMAVHAGERLLELEPGNALIRLLVLRMNQLHGISEDSLKVKRCKKGIVTKESLGCSWTEVKNTVYAFIVGDENQSAADILYSWLKGITAEIKRPDPYQGLHIEEEEKEEIGGIHSERLAMAFALINSQASQGVRIMKNLRMCGDCHRTAKFISLTYGREIYINDSKCLHHFKEGQCSCGDYW